MDQILARAMQIYKKYLCTETCKFMPCNGGNTCANENVCSRMFVLWFKILGPIHKWLWE